MHVFWDDNTRGGTRARNLLLRREAPYPLDHTSTCVHGGVINRVDGQLWTATSNVRVSAHACTACCGHTCGHNTRTHAATLQ